MTGRCCFTPTGRAMLWLVVISACLSMYGYFRSFYRVSVLHPELRAAKPRATEDRYGAGLVDAVQSYLRPGELYERGLVSKRAIPSLEHRTCLLH